MNTFFKADYYWQFISHVNGNTKVITYLNGKCIETASSEDLK